MSEVWNSFDLLILEHPVNNPEDGMDPKEKKVIDALKKEGKPMRPGDIAKKTAMDKDEVAKIIDRLIKEGKVSSPKRCFYAPV